MNKITVSRADCQTGKPLHLILKNGETYTVIISKRTSEGDGWWISETDVTPFEGSGSPSAGFVEMEDLLFHLDSAVFLPEGVGTPQKSSAQDTSGASEEQQTVEGLPVVAWLLLYIKNAAVEGTKLVIAGHTDSSGDQSYNKKLSFFRSKSLHFILRGDQTAKDGWCSLFKSEKNDGVTVRINEDIQHILKWAGKKYGWQCDPGEIDGVIGSTTETAINTYKKQYQLAFNKGNVGSGDFWSITFDLYQQEIASLLDVEISELDQEYRKSISWDSDVFSVGCGEAWPVDHKKIDNRHSQSDRRVEILLIDPDDSITLSCTTGSCEGENCPIYGNDEEGNPRCSRSRLSMGDFVPSGPESSDTTRHRISLQLLSPNYFPLANLSCTLNGSDKQESDCDGYVEWPSCADYNNMVTISSGAGSVQIEVPWITNSDPSHTVLLMNAGKITGSDSSVYGIQIRLKGLGHDCGTIDGVAGPKTAEALRQFQKDNDLDESGIADEGTQILLSLKFGA